METIGMLFFFVLFFFFFGSKNRWFKNTTVQCAVMRNVTFLSAFKDPSNLHREQA